MRRSTLAVLTMTALAVLTTVGQATSAVPAAMSEDVNRPISGPLTNPTARCCMGMDYDSLHDRFFLFGGTGDNNEILGQTWMGKWTEGTPDTFDWTQLNASNPPSDRHSHRMVFWPVAGDEALVLFGGTREVGGDSNETWIGTAGSGTGFQWENVTPSDPDDSPSARASMGMAYDAALHKIILYGGLGDGIQDDTWTGEWDSGTGVFTWEKRCDGPADPCAPGELTSPAIGHDTQAVARTVMHGGRSDEGPTDQTWVWDDTVSDWVNRTGTSTTVDITTHRMVYDSLRQRFVLFGGSTPGTPTLDTTYLGIRQGGFYNWTLGSPNPHPSARCCTGMAFDPDRDEAISFGGAEEDPPNPPIHFDDTWRFDTNWDCIRGTCSPG